MQKEDTYIALLALILLISLALIATSNVTGYATTSTTSSNVSIIKYLSIALSTNLSNGIQFGSVSTLPATDVNATANYVGGTSNSTMFINVSTDSNVAVDFCIQANTGLTDGAGGHIIGIGNETYANATIANATVAGQAASSISLTTSYVKSSLATGQGNVTYYRFWLDVPAGTASGDYNNSIGFKGVETTTAC